MILRKRDQPIKNRQIIKLGFEPSLLFVRLKALFVVFSTDINKKIAIRLFINSLVILRQ